MSFYPMVMDLIHENCRCKELERDRQNVLNMMNNKNFIIAQNKAKCGFSKRDLEELRLPIRNRVNKKEI